MKQFPDIFYFIRYKDLVLNLDNINKLVNCTIILEWNLDNDYEIKTNTAQRQSEKKETNKKTKQCSLVENLLINCQYQTT